MSGLQSIKKNNFYPLKKKFFPSKTNLPEASLNSRQFIYGDNRDPDENEDDHAPAQSQTPEWVLDCSVTGGFKGNEGPDQDHLEK